MISVYQHITANQGLVILAPNMLYKDILKVSLGGQIMAWRQPAGNTSTKIAQIKSFRKKLDNATGTLLPNQYFIETYYNGMDGTSLASVGPNIEEGARYRIHAYGQIAEYEVQEGDTQEDVRDALIDAFNELTWPGDVEAEPVLGTDTLQIKQPLNIIPFNRYQYDVERPITAKYLTGYYASLNVMGSTDDYLILLLPSAVGYLDLPELTDYDFSELTNVHNLRNYLNQAGYIETEWSTTEEGNQNVTNVPSAGDVIAPDECIYDEQTAQFIFPFTISDGLRLKVLFKKKSSSI